MGSLLNTTTPASYQRPAELTTHPQENFEITSFPAEMLKKIVHYLPLKDRASFLQTCRKINDCFPSLHAIKQAVSQGGLSEELNKKYTNLFYSALTENVSEQTLHGLKKSNVIAYRDGRNTRIISEAKYNPAIDGHQPLNHIISQLEPEVQVIAKNYPKSTRGVDVYYRSPMNDLNRLERLFTKANNILLENQGNDGLIAVQLVGTIKDKLLKEGFVSEKNMQSLVSKFPDLFFAADLIKQRYPYDDQPTINVPHRFHDIKRLNIELARQL